MCDFSLSVGSGPFWSGCGSWFGFGIWFNSVIFATIKEWGKWEKNYKINFLMAFFKQDQLISVFPWETGQPLAPFSLSFFTPEGTRGWGLSWGTGHLLPCWSPILNNQNCYLFKAPITLSYSALDKYCASIALAVACAWRIPEKSFLVRIWHFLFPYLLFFSISLRQSVYLFLFPAMLMPFIYGRSSATLALFMQGMLPLARQ